MGYGSDYLAGSIYENAQLFQDAFSVISRVLSILVFLANATVISVMLVKCTKFRRTRVYEDYNGIKTLSKALEVIVIFLVIEAVYGLTRIFSIIDAMNLINALIPDFPREIFAYLIFITIVLPILGCAISIFAWSYYHKTRRLFFSVYPNGVQPVDFSQSAYTPDDSIFGSSSVSDLSYCAKGAKSAAFFSGENIGDGLADMGEQSFYAKASTINSKSAANTKNEANAVNGINARNEGQNEVNTASRVNQPVPDSHTAVRSMDDFFGAGVSNDYINRITAADEARLETLLVQDTPDAEYRVTQAQSNEGDIFGTGSKLWEAVPDMSDPLISELLVTDEEPKAEVYESGQNSLFGSGTTEDYMKRFTTADDNIISELLVQDELAEQ